MEEWGWCRCFAKCIETLRWEGGDAISFYGQCGCGRTGKERPLKAPHFFIVARFGVNGCVGFLIADCCAVHGDWSARELVEGNKERLCVSDAGRHEGEQYGEAVRWVKFCDTDKEVSSLVE